jgi:protein SCO1/2
MEKYMIPDVTLINQDGAPVALRKLFAADMPVLVDFVFTTCTTICPVLSANFANFQNTIIDESGKVLLVSISLDPDSDTPRKTKDYLKRFKAKPGWEFLTGSEENIVRVLKAFNALPANGMNRFPVILLKSPSDERWVRLCGLLGANQLLTEYEKVRY